MRFALLSLYRPTLASDGRHGFTEALANATNLWGAIRVHDVDITLIYRNGEDVKVSDIVVADSGCYRVMNLLGNPGAAFHNAALERINRPIFPDDESCVGSSSGP